MISQNLACRFSRQDSVQKAALAVHLNVHETMLRQHFSVLFTRPLFSFTRRREHYQGLEVYAHRATFVVVQQGLNK